MISQVTYDQVDYNELPYKFEAGTPDISGAVALGAAIDYLNGIGLGRIAAYERELLTYARAAVDEIPGIRRLGPSEGGTVISFLLDDIHPHDVATFLDADGIAVRAGNHCAQPLMERCGVPGTVRASFSFYNTREEADKLVDALRKTIRIFGI